MFDDFDLDAVDPGGLESFRGQLHLEAVFQEGEEVQGTCDAFFDLPELANGPSLNIDIPGLPGHHWSSAIWTFVGVWSVLDGGTWLGETCETETAEGIGTSIVSPFSAASLA